MYLISKGVNNTELKPSYEILCFDFLIYYKHYWNKKNVWIWFYDLSGQFNYSDGTHKKSFENVNKNWLYEKPTV